MIPSVRWGILGTGRIAGIFARELAHSQTGRLTAVGSRTLASAKHFTAGFPGVRPHGRQEELFADPNVDAVYIASPHPWHAGQAIAALQAGKHVLCEKPLAMNFAEARRIIDEAARSRQFLMEAFMYRCHPRTKRIAEIIRSGRIGRVRLIEAAFCFNAPFDENSRLYSPALGGGGILDVGCYTMSVARFVAGAASGTPFEDPVSVSGAIVPAPTGVDGLAAATLTFPGGILAQLLCGVALSRGDDLVITGTEGSLRVQHFWKPPGPIEIRNGDHVEIEPPFGSTHLYALEADAMAAALPAFEAPEMLWADTLGNAAALDIWLRGNRSVDAAVKTSRPIPH